MANVLNFKRFQLWRGRYQLTDHLIVTAANGKSYGFAKPPTVTETPQFTAETASATDAAAREFTEDDASSLAAVRALAAFVKFTAATEDVMRDNMASDLGRANRLAPLRTGLVVAIARASSQLDAIETALAATEVSLYGPAKIPAGDMQMANDDQELRAWFYKIGSDERAVLLNDLASDQPTAFSERALLALKRQPTPLPATFADAIELAWRKAAARREPTRANALAVARAHFDWARSVVDALGQYVLAAANLQPLDIAGALLGAQLEDQASLFGITDADVRALRARFDREAELARQGIAVRGAA